MKKYLNTLCLGCSAFFLVLNFAFMALPGATLTVFGATAKESIYGMLEDSGILVVAMVFVIIALLAVVFALLVEFKLFDFKFAGFVLLGAALFALLAGIFYFCACTGNYDGADLGVGAVLCGLLSIFAAFGAGFIGCKKVLNK